MPIIIPEFEDLYQSLYLMAEIATSPYTKWQKLIAQKLRPFQAAPPYQAFLGSETPGHSR